MPFRCISVTFPFVYGPCTLNVLPSELMLKLMLPTSSLSLASDITLDFYYVLACCLLKVLPHPTKEIKETESEGYESLKGEGWEKMFECPQEKIKDGFCHATLNCDSL